mgnify:CR=1 FL=1
MAIIPENLTSFARFVIGNQVASVLGNNVQGSTMDVQGLSPGIKAVMHAAIANAKKAGRTQVKYEDYPKLVTGEKVRDVVYGVRDNISYARMIGQSFIDPVLQTSTLLGQFSFTDKGDGSFDIVDEYDFSKKSFKIGSSVKEDDYQKIRDFAGTQQKYSWNIRGTLPSNITPSGQAVSYVAGKGKNIKENVASSIASISDEIKDFSEATDELSQETIADIAETSGKISAGISDIASVVAQTGTNYASRFFTAIENELSLDAIADENITTEKFSPEALATIKHSLDKYFTANPNQTEVETSSGFLGFDSETLMDQVVAKRTPDGGYQLVDASDPSQNKNILVAGRRYAQGLAEQVDQAITSSTDWFANQFQEDSINIDIKIPPVIEAVSDAMDDYFGIEETAMIPKFRPNPLTKSRRDKMYAVLDKTELPEVEQPNNLDVLGFGEAFARSRNAGQRTFTWRGNDYTTLYKEEQESLDGENTSMDTQGGQEPKGGIERSGSQVVQTGDTQTAS